MEGYRRDPDEKIREGAWADDGGQVVDPEAAEKAATEAAGTGPTAGNPETADANKTSTPDLGGGSSGGTGIGGDTLDLTGPSYLGGSPAMGAENPTPMMGGPEV